MKISFVLYILSILFFKYAHCVDMICPYQKNKDCYIRCVNSNDNRDVIYAYVEEGKACYKNTKSGTVYGKCNGNGNCR